MIYHGFPKSVLNILLCPKDEGELAVEQAGEFLTAGDVRCVTCGQVYKIDQGILRLDELIDNQQMKQEVVARDAGAGRYDERLSPRFYSEIKPTLKLLGEVLDQTILEYGAGTGRLTAELAGAGLVVAVDFSFSSLQLLAAKQINSPLALICADATAVKFKAGTFDKVVATQLIEHIPTRELRQQFYNLIKKHLAANGLFLASVYHHDLRRRRKKMTQEGEHKGGIFYHYFTEMDWQEELGGVFSKIKIGYLDLTWPLLSRFKLSLKMVGWLSQVGTSIPLIRQLSHLLYVKAK
ncbi:MAG: methyltransferase domain-containing protein [Candidatus Pacebacteria bacterium]|nr:methyltransferase domain-containing protein [Candidatus Paceibacterota bacterium]